MASAYKVKQAALGVFCFHLRAARHPECAIAAILCPLAAIHVIFRLLPTSRRRNDTHSLGSLKEWATSQYDLISYVFCANSHNFNLRSRLNRSPRLARSWSATTGRNNLELNGTPPPLSRRSEPFSRKAAAASITRYSCSDGWFLFTFGILVAAELTCCLPAARTGCPNCRRSCGMSRWQTWPFQVRTWRCPGRESVVFKETVLFCCFCNVFQMSKR